MLAPFEGTKRVPIEMPPFIRELLVADGEHLICHTGPFGELLLPCFYPYIGVNFSRFPTSANWKFLVCTLDDALGDDELPVRSGFAEFLDTFPAKHKILSLHKVIPDRRPRGVEADLEVGTGLRSIRRSWR